MASTRLTPFASQQRIIDILPSIADIAGKHGLEATPWQAHLEFARDFRVRVPLIGIFSAGKTSLVNALLGEKLFSVELTPETALPAEISWADAPNFKARLASGECRTLTRDDLAANRAAEEGPETTLEIGHPAPVLARWPHLILVDLPGWDSGIAAHERAIDRYAGKSLAYALVVGADEGALRESLRQVIQELAVLKLPVFLVISKCDKRPPEAVDAVAAHVRAELVQLYGSAPLAEAQVSARKGSIDPFIQALDKLEARAEERFAAGVIAPVAGDLARLAGHLDILAQRQFHDAEKLKAESETLAGEIARFNEQLEKETNALRAKLEPVMSTLRCRLESELSAKLEQFTATLESGGDPSDAMLLTARAVIVSTVQQEFEPALARYAARLDDNLPHSLALNIARSGSSGLNNEGGSSSGLQNTLRVLTPMLTKVVPGPWGVVAVIVVNILAAIFGSSENRRNQAIEAARERERMRHAVMDAIQKTLDAVENAVRPTLAERIEDAARAVAEAIGRERQTREELFARKAEELAQGEAAAEAARQKAAADLAVVQKHLAECSAFLDAATTVS